ncbi:MAG: hypothetical protein JWM90_2643 [Thermoleophilia bacterium]|nr:hypothetical protein [Thermoleophilia bacterium]
MQDFGPHPPSRLRYRLAMTESPEPQIHRFDDAESATAFAAEHHRRDRERTEVGLHVVVLVVAGETTAYARVQDPESVGHLTGRWLRVQRRGVSPAAWSELHHPRAEAPVGPWKADHELALDRLLIEHGKRAWHMLGEPPYVVEFPTLPTSSFDLV